MSASVVRLNDETNCYLIASETSTESCGSLTITNCFHQQLWCKFEEMNCGFQLPCLPNLDVPNQVYIIQSGESAKFRITSTPHFTVEEKLRTPKVATTVRGELTVYIWGFDPGHRFLPYPNMREKLVCLIEIPSHEAKSVSVIVKVERININR